VVATHPTQADADDAADDPSVTDHRRDVRWAVRTLDAYLRKKRGSPVPLNAIIESLSTSAAIFTAR